MAGKEIFDDSSIPNLYTEQRKNYEEYVFKSFSWQFIEKPLLDRELQCLASPESRILDAGCGAGRTLSYLLDRGYPASNLIGVDINKDMLEISSQKAPKTQLVRADLENLPFPPNHVDLIMCNHVLHYFDERKFAATMATFFRTLNQKVLFSGS